jgi:uncharacterized iron-regulated membrane protein
MDTEAKSDEQAEPSPSGANSAGEARRAGARAAGRPRGDRPKAKPRSRLERLAMRRRRGVMRIHRWLSVVAGVWLLLQGATGVVMVGRDQILHWQHPRLDQHGDGDLGVGPAIGAARQAVPDAAFPGTVILPAAAGGVYRVAMIMTPQPLVQRLVYVDPATAEVNGIVDPTEGLVAWVDRWHEDLLQTDEVVFGVTGEDIVGAFTVLTVGILLSGMWVWWWPRVQRWRQMRRLRLGRGPYTFSGDLHRVVGALATPVLVVLCLTGLALAFPGTARSTWYAITPGRDTGPRADSFVNPAPPPESTPAGPEARPLPLDEQVERAEAAVPDSEAVSVRGAGQNPTGSVTVKLSHGWDPARGPEASGGNVTVYLDQFSGDVLRLHRPEDKAFFGQLFEYWNRSVHRGTFGGLPIRLAWLLTSITPLVLLVTGLALVLIRSGKRRRRERRVRQALPRLSRSQVREVAAHAVARDLEPGKVVVHHGEPPDSFYIVTKGELAVTDDEGRLINAMLPGDHFGEIGMLGDLPRTATVTARSKAEVLAVSRPGFVKLLDMSLLTHVDLTSIAATRQARSAAVSGAMPKPERPEG